MTHHAAYDLALQEVEDRTARQHPRPPRTSPPAPRSPPPSSARYAVVLRG
jgi:hypothetical protein